MGKRAYRPPKWLFGDDLPGRILALRRDAPGRTALDRSTRAIADAIGLKPATLHAHIAKIRGCAAGGGEVDSETDRKTAALFVETYDRIGPTNRDLSAEHLAKIRSAEKRTPAQAASSFERMQKLTRDVERIAGVGAR